jgi:hypothetical protein
MVKVHRIVDGVFTTSNKFFDSFEQAKKFVEGVSGHHSLKILDDHGTLLHIDSPAEAGLVTLDVPASLSITVN